MRKVALTIFVILASALAGFASNSPCTQMTYDNYIAQGFACDIGDKTFSDFSYAYSSNPPGFGLPAGGLTAVPITTPGDPGFTFEGGWFASTSSGVLEQDSTLGFAATVNPGGALITDLSLFIEGVGFDGTGSIVVDETACLGAMLPTCTGGTIIQLRVCDSSSCNTLSDTVNFAGVSEVDVVKDITVQAGTNGDASLSIVGNQFSEGATTPEPSTLSMLGVGVLTLGGLMRRKLNL
jgi:hypothetical protein